MSDRWQVGWEGSRQIITYTIDVKALPLQMKIMMMRDRRDTCLGNKFRDRQAQRNVQRNRDCILNNQHLQHEATRKFVQLLFEMFFKFIHAACHGWRAYIDREKILVQYSNLRMRLARFLCHHPTS